MCPLRFTGSRVHGKRVRSEYPRLMYFFGFFFRSASTESACVTSPRRSRVEQGVLQQLARVALAALEAGEQVVGPAARRSRFAAMCVRLALDVWKFCIVESIFAESIADAARRNSHRQREVAILLRRDRVELRPRGALRSPTARAAFAIVRRMSRMPPAANSSAFSVFIITLHGARRSNPRLFSIAWMSVARGPHRHRVARLEVRPGSGPSA